MNDQQTVYQNKLKVQLSKTFSNVNNRILSLYNGTENTLKNDVEKEAKNSN